MEFYAGIILLVIFVLFPVFKKIDKRNDDIERRLSNLEEQVPDFFREKGEKISGYTLSITLEPDIKKIICEIYNDLDKDNIIEFLYKKRNEFGLKNNPININQYENIVAFKNAISNQTLYWNPKIKTIANNFYIPSLKLFDEDFYYKIFSEHCSEGIVFTSGYGYISLGKLHDFGGSGEYGTFPLADVLKILSENFKHPMSDLQIYFEKLDKLSDNNFKYNFFEDEFISEHVFTGDYFTVRLNIEYNTIYLE